MSRDYDPAVSYAEKEMFAGVDEAERRYVHLDVLQKLNQADKMLSVKTLAEWLDVSENFIRKQIRLGKLRCSHPGDVIRLNPPDVVAWLQPRANDVGESGTKN
jgi:excisionase family DNA binding protein